MPKKSAVSRWKVTREREGYWVAELKLGRFFLVRIVQDMPADVPLENSFTGFLLPVENDGKAGITEILTVPMFCSLEQAQRQMLGHAAGLFKTAETMVSDELQLGG